MLMIFSDSTTEQELAKKHGQGRPRTTSPDSNRRAPRDQEVEQVCLGINTEAQDIKRASE
ncbi:hypothetical protein Q7C36_017987 [Tachysurus vachellii]|uniref:Uncharacterized protein n=1 Tax=Tachysurus vachellii TaxID=175792 RepID=A0AA88LYY1_TACVA|nr:hypothetical protein Q7C36_017987 [Tachysurus vachellii]